MPRLPPARRPRFTLSFLLFWVMPYVAAALALTTWSGPYASGFLNRHARTTALLGLTIAWIVLFASRLATRHDAKEQDEERGSGEP